jgi:carbamoyl-phosphate synthase large subunit/carbamoyl-phosphate synthase small subunit
MFPGISFGANKAIAGEAVFNTGMVGYPESLTDPSYRGQILTFTYPSLGNYGVPAQTNDELGLRKHFESDRIQVAGVIVAEYSWEWSHWNGVESLSDWLKREGIPGLTGIDTRALTKKIREQGAMLGKIVFDQDVPFDDPNLRNLVDEVSVKKPVVYGPPGGFKVIAVDCGIKANVIRQLVERGCEVTVVPWDYNFLEMLEQRYDGLYISNGPGDPALLGPLVENVTGAIELGKPIFGICMGNHVLARAAGAETYKLPFGNRGQNQPVVDVNTSSAYITPQNHGFAVNTSSLRPPWRQLFYNANDFSNEGIVCEGRPFYSVQFHPEARGGPYDTDFLFDRFIQHMKEFKHSGTVKHQIKPVNKALILGSGGLQIGQAGEFDYSGSQAIKSLLTEGIHTVLMNPNIATVQTAKGLADRVYFCPVTKEFVEKVIEKEKPDSLLLQFGGQTALNVGVELYQSGILAKHNVQVLGTSVETIIATEDRQIFKDKLDEINVGVAPSIAAETVEDSLVAAEKLGYPVIVRVAFALGGLGSGFAHNRAEMEELCIKAFAVAPQALVEKSVKGWKEVEYEVVRDSYNNCVTVCNMENFDPMGIHTGESIVIAPSQTLTNEEYHKLRLAAIRVVQHLGIIGECNIQYALDPNSENFFVIEVNPRLSRSSALASKATGYPLAAVAAKLALGHQLPSIPNSITKTTSACFEPSLDYLVVKIPRWDLNKFPGVDPHLGSAMKSVGEVMAIGRNFEEALQKALRMVDTRNNGFEARAGKYPNNATGNAAIEQELKAATDMRIWAIAEALDRGISIDRIYELSKIDHWWLKKLENIKQIRDQLKSIGDLKNVQKSLLSQAKLYGFSDKQIGSYVGAPELEVREYRKAKGVIPVSKQIDTLAAEFPAQTNYLYVTYGGSENDVAPAPGAVTVLGSGTYRIGSSVEFDYGAVSCIRTLRNLGEKTIMINYNPETVSTDYDESDRLYFEELSLERVLDIVDFEQPKGVVVSVGGQQPQNLALPLYKAKVPILGTSPVMIDNAEDRYKFSKLLDEIGVKQPEWKELTDTKEAKEFANRVGYPCLVRPSYVLSGAAMKVAYNDEQLDEYLGAAAEVSPEHPVVMTKFLLGAEEVELDAVANKGRLVNWAVSEHIENAGVHSGDATLVFPSDKIAADIQARVRGIGAKIAKALQISGPFNVQFLEKNGELGVIECNLRSSRSFPFVSKCLDVDFIETATRIFLGQNPEPDQRCEGTPPKLNHVSVKAPQFSWVRLKGSDPVLGVEMSSTGEVACYARDRYEAYLQAIISAGFKVPKKGVCFSGNMRKEHIPYIKKIQNMGLDIYATPETFSLLDKSSISYKKLDMTLGDTGARNAFRFRNADLLVNFVFPEGKHEEMRTLRRHGIDMAIPVITNERLFAMTVDSLEKVGNNFTVVGWDELHPQPARVHKKQAQQIVMKARAPESPAYRKVRGGKH